MFYFCMDDKYDFRGWVSHLENKLRPCSFESRCWKQYIGAFWKWFCNSVFLLASPLYIPKKCMFACTKGWIWPPRGVFRNQLKISDGAFFQKQLKAVNYFCKKAPLPIFVWVPNTSLPSTLTKLNSSLIIRTLLWISPRERISSNELYWSQNLNSDDKLSRVSR